MKFLHTYITAIFALISIGLNAQNVVTDKPIVTDQRGQITNEVTPDSLIIPGIDQKQRNASIQDKIVTDTETVPEDKLQGTQPSSTRKDD